MTGSGLEHEGVVLGHIHAEANYRKALAYWLGFLRGVLASDDVENAELGPLAAEARAFLGHFGSDATILIRDLDRVQPGDERHAYEVVDAILARRSNEMVLGLAEDTINEFYGFCAGIACDNRITPAEVEKLLGKISPELMSDARISALHHAATLSIRDGEITPEESEDICQWITRLVGDSAADTGIATFGNVGIVDGAIEDHSNIVFDGRMFVLGTRRPPVRSGCARDSWCRRCVAGRCQRDGGDDECIRQASSSGPRRAMDGRRVRLHPRPEFYRRRPSETSSAQR